jgi:hypothetical protein
MALNHADRAFLEEDFAQFLEQIPSLVLLSRTENYKMSIQSNGADDFVLGFTNGMLWVGFINYFAGRHMRELAEDETREFFEILHKRNRVIKEAIFKCSTFANHKKI